MYFFKFWGILFWILKYIYIFYCFLLFLIVVVIFNMHFPSCRMTEGLFFQSQWPSMSLNDLSVFPRSPVISLRFLLRFPQKEADLSHRLTSPVLSPATWHACDLRSWRQFDLPWVVPPALAPGPLCSTVKWNVCPLSSMPSTTLAGVTRSRRKTQVNVTVELFQLSQELQDNSAPCQQSPVWVWASGEGPGWKIVEAREWHLSWMNPPLPMLEAYCIT